MGGGFPTLLSLPCLFGSGHSLRAFMAPHLRCHTYRSSSRSIFSSEEISRHLFVGSFLRAPTIVAVTRVYLICFIARRLRAARENARPQEVESSTAQAYADEIGAMFVETSAKDDTHVQDMFVELSKRLPKREPRPVPSSVDLNADSSAGASSCC